MRTQNFGKRPLDITCNVRYSGFLWWQLILLSWVSLISFHKKNWSSRLILKGRNKIDFKEVCINKYYFENKIKYITRRCINFYSGYSKIHSEPETKLDFQFVCVVLNLILGSNDVKFNLQLGYFTQLHVFFVPGKEIRVWTHT